MAVKFPYRSLELATANIFQAVDAIIEQYQYLPEHSPFRVYGIALYELKQRFMDEAAKAARLEKENIKAIGFLNWLVEDLFDGSYPEGPEVIQEMVDYGFLVEHEATEANRTEWENIPDVDVGETFYLRSELLKNNEGK